MPGSMPMSFLSGPMLESISIWSYISLRVNFPDMIFLVVSSAASSLMFSLAVSSRDCRSPIPSRREMNRVGMNGSRSSRCSPDADEDDGRLGPGDGAQRAAALGRAVHLGDDDAT